MPLMLCLETSSDATVLGLADGKHVIAEILPDSRDALDRAVAVLLTETKKAPAAIAIGIGPGSFTGLRVGLAYAKGFARGKNLPIYPVPSLQIIAANLQSQAEAVGVISPARRGEVHFGLFDADSLEPLHEPLVIPHAELVGRLPADAALLGPGVTKLEPELKNKIEAAIPDDADLHRPHVLHLARLALEIWKDKDPPDIGSLVPVYGLDFPPAQ